MSLYASYVREREGKEIIESEKGFATFIITGEECYIQDIYVVPEARKSGEASLMADQIAVIAKERGCKYLTGSVCPQAKGSTASLKVLLGYGFQLLKCDSNLVWFYKEIK